MVRGFFDSLTTNLGNYQQLTFLQQPSLFRFFLFHQVPSYILDYVQVTAWVQDSGVHLYPNTDIGGKYIVLSNGDLYINNAGPSDAYKTYSCRTVNRLTGGFLVN